MTTSPSSRLRRLIDAVTAKSEPWTLSTEDLKRMREIADPETPPIEIDLTGRGLSIAAALAVVVTLAWWLRLLYHDNFTAPEDLALPLALAFLAGILSTAATMVGGRD